MGLCVCCDREKDTRYGVCFECAGFEALVEEKKDMDDNKVVMKISGYSESLNIVRAIIKYAEKRYKGK